MSGGVHVTYICILLESNTTEQHEYTYIILA